MARLTNLTMPGIEIANAYAVVGMVAVNRLQGRVTYQVDYFLDEKTRRQYSAAFSDLYGKEAARDSAQKNLMDMQRKVLAKGAKSDQDDNDAIFAAKTAVTQAVVEVDEARRRVAEQSIQPLRQVGNLVMILREPSANISDIVALIYADLKSDGALLAVGEDS